MRGYLSGLAAFMSQFIPVKSSVNAGEYSGSTGSFKQYTFKLCGDTIEGFKNSKVEKNSTDTRAFFSQQGHQLWGTFRKLSYSQDLS